MAIRVQAAAFDPGQELNALHAANTGIGAVVGFVGYVRDFNDGRDVGGLFLEHFPGMTEKALARIVEEAKQRWPLLGVDILHRVGRLEPGEPIVFVGTASAHRQAAFDALHADELASLEARDLLARCDRVFSRDAPAGEYVQHRLERAADTLREWVAGGAAIYVCGNAVGMAPAVHETLGRLLGADALARLAEEGRYRRDVY